jgi:hypothetical protein
MELFIPSVLVLLLAAAMVFFILPRFGAPVLALISVGLLAFGIYQHMNAFKDEYRFSTWQQGLVGYAPYVMIGGLLVVVAFYLLTISPLGKPTAPNVNMPDMPSVNEMPSANTATNAITAGVNTALKGISNAAGTAAAAVGVGNAAKQGNANKGVAAATGNAVAAVNNAAKKAAEGVQSALSGITGAANQLKNAVVGNGSKGNNKGGLGLGQALGLGTGEPSAPKANNRPSNNKGLGVPGLKFPLSQI